MKKRLACLLVIAIVLFAFISCGKEAIGEASVLEPQSIGTKESYVKPTKTEFSQEDQQTIDRYYQEMVSLYPQFGNIPREMLNERIYETNDGKDLNVSFTYCFGGIPTDCRCTFSISTKYPQGNWKVEEDVFSQFYQSGLDESVMSQIRSSLSKGINEYIDANHLKKTELSNETLPLYWQITDGQIYSCCEWIANTTLFTTKKFGCGDHAHIFGKVLVELTDETVQLTVFSVTGG